MKVRPKVILIIISTVLMITSLSVGVGISITQRKLLETIRGDLRLTCEITEEHLAGTIGALKDTITFIADELRFQASGGTIRMGEIERLAVQSAERFHILGLTIFEREGQRARVLANYGGYAPSPDLECIALAWKGESHISTTQYDGAKGDLVFRVGVPMGDRVLVATVSGIFLSRIVTNFRLWKTGNVFVTDKDGTMIGHFRDWMVLERTNYTTLERADPEALSIRRFIGHMVRTEQGIGYYRFLGDDRVGVYTTIRGTDRWYVGIAAPVSESPVTQARVILLITGLVALGLGVLAAFIFAGQIAGPIEKTDLQNQELARLFDAAEAANRAKSNFLAKMSHEIRTPMNAIIGMSDLMPTSNMDEIQLSYFEDIKRMSKSLLGLINDILDFSKIEAGKFDLVPVHFDFWVLFDNVCSMCRFIAQGKGLEFRAQRIGDIPQFLYGDEIRIRQIFTNLINNAVKYTREGSVSFTVSREIRKAQDGGEAEKGEQEYLAAVVEDTGIGIKAEDIPKLFGIFQQLDTQKNRRITGTGLGLAITKNLLDMMGGFIEVKSEYGKGSCFTAFIPLVPGDPSKVKFQKGRIPAVMAAGDISILVVDDMRENLTVALGFLQVHGMKADTASEGLEALDMVEKMAAQGRRYDLIFMDHMMPGIDGIETVRRIRAFEKDRSLPPVPIVALSANALAGIGDTFLAAGMNDFLSKPIEGEEFNAVLLKWLPKEKLRVPEAPSQKAENGKAGILARLRAVPGLDPDLGLRHTGGLMENYRLLLRQFSKGLDEGIRRFRSSVENEDWKNCGIHAHGFKGVMRTVGHGKLGEWAYRLELAGRDGDGETCRNEADAFCNTLLEFRANLAAAGLLASEAGEDGPGTRVDAGALGEILVRLREACESYRDNAIEEALAALKGISYDPRTDAELKEIRDLVDSFDYREAAEKILNLEKRISVELT